MTRRKPGVRSFNISGPAIIYVAIMSIPLSYDTSKEEQSPVNHPVNVNRLLAMFNGNYVLDEMSKELLLKKASPKE